jgi:hypothetical protein
VLAGIRTALTPAGGVRECLCPEDRAFLKTPFQHKEGYTMCTEKSDVKDWANFDPSTLQIPKFNGQSITVASHFEAPVPSNIPSANFRLPQRGGNNQRVIFTGKGPQGLQLVRTISAPAVPTIGSISHSTASSVVPVKLFPVEEGASPTDDGAFRP